MKSNKKPTLIAVFLLLALTRFGSAQTPTYSDIFQAAWAKVNESFFDPRFTGIDWKAVGDRYRPEAERVKTDAEFFSLMQKMLKELPVSHLHIGMPRESGLVGTGTVTRQIGGQSVVAHVPVTSDAHMKGIRSGDILLNPADEPGKLGSLVKLRLKACDGRLRNVEVRRESHSQPERPSIRWRSFSSAEGRRIGYIRAVRFDDDTAPLVDAAMAELKNTHGIIIDVRDNSGGNMSFVRLSSYFSEGEHLVAALLTRHYLESQGSTPKLIDPNKLPKAVQTYTNEKIFDAMRSNGGAVAIFSEDLGESRYRGKIAVLINEETGSAAEGFAWHVKLKTRATIIGQRTAGALLGAEYFTLPGGWRLAVPTHSGWGPDGRPVIDQPVEPHVKTEWSRNDVCAGKDPDIAKALEVVAGDSRVSLGGRRRDL